MDTAKDNNIRPARLILDGQAVAADYVKLIAVLNGWALEEICFAIQGAFSGQKTWLEFRLLGTFELEAAR